jgi:16S rRNA (guanine527-N7)-methyltransferase
VGTLPCYSRDHMTTAALQTLRELAARYGLDDTACRALATYVAAVAGWRDANVTGVSEPDEIARTLVGDALALLTLEEIAGAGASPAGPWLDLGSGAGVPGIPVAVAMPAVKMVLLESIGKKCVFLGHALAQTGLEGRAEVVCSRSEQYAAGPPGRAAHQRVLSRAVGQLATVVELAAPLLMPGGVLVVCTSADRAVQEEDSAGRAAQACGLASRRTVLLAASPLQHSAAVLFENVGAPPDWLPRRPGLARRRPLVR